jgi:hypothetical protein
METERLGDPERLVRGTPRQRAAAAALERAGVFRRLAAHDPVLAGTIPIRVDVETSDLDVLCRADEPDAFGARLSRLFGDEPGFSLRRLRRDGLPTVIARFRSGAFPVELFGQPLAPRRQTAYRHMVAEARLLDAADPGARRTVRRLKRRGLATEPAFARCFRLEGDPYEVLLELADAPPEVVREVAARAG